MNLSSVVAVRILLPLWEKVDRPKVETDEGYPSAIADVEAYPSSALRAPSPARGEGDPL
jgi:hypothetical protein